MWGYGTNVIGVQARIFRNLGRVAGWQWGCGSERRKDIQPNWVMSVGNSAWVQTSAESVRVDLLCLCTATGIWIYLLTLCGFNSNRMSHVCMSLNIQWILIKEKQEKERVREDWGRSMHLMLNICLWAPISVISSIHRLVCLCMYVCTVYLSIYLSIHS